MNTGLGRQWNTRIADWKFDADVALSDGDHEKFLEIWHTVKAARDKAEKAGDILLQCHLERTLGQWLARLTDMGILEPLVAEH